MDYSVVTNSLGGISEGLQQPYEILIVSGIGETDIDLTYFVYPNPATDFVMLNIQNENTQNMTYRLYDVKGRLIENQKINASQTSISMTNLANDIYFIKVLNGNTELKIFKIIKNK